jgi:hypothetical protein
MPRVTPAHRSVGVTSEPFRYCADIVEGGLLVIGKGGDVDPGNPIEDLTTRNVGGEDLFLASSLRGALGTTAYFDHLPADAGPALERLVDTYFVCNRAGSGGTGRVSLNGSQLPINNSGGTKPCHPGHGCYPFRVPAVNSGPSTVTRTVHVRETVAHVGVYSAAKRTLTGTYTLVVRVRRNGVVRNLLEAATFDLESLTNGVLSSPTLTPISADLILEPTLGDSLEVVATSDNTLSAGDLLVAIETTPL